VLKKLLAVGVVLLTAASMAVPTLAQTAAPANADLTLEWGSEAWFRNQFGVNGDISAICNTIGQNAATQADWTAQFPDLPQWCGWDQQGTTQQSAPATQQTPSQQSTPTTTQQAPPAQQGTAQYAQYA
jgi:hypothetical protein